MPADLLEMIAKGGVIAVLAYGWWSEKQRADKERERNDQLSREVVTAMVKFDGTLQNVAAIFGSIKNGGSPP